MQDEPVYTRIRMLQYTTTLQLFSEIMEDYNASLLKYHDKCLLLLQQQRTLLRRQLTSVELDHMLDAQETSLFVDNILEDSKIARQQLSDIESRHNDVLKLEKSITEVRDIFAEMAFLIEEQAKSFYRENKLITLNILLIKLRIISTVDAFTSASQNRGAIDIESGKSRFALS
ncbi:Syntaxin-1B [Temnothorax longispinosus]|uniref:Syntaxin-1B n=1 Tax=Temnothorax longispinosus TaxID=300112 RepID=A0A4S2KWV4_9HYME|nr:Syntaxin-1B [Temnothorax longispinosus]